jgi:hypothetical protein
MQNLLKTQPKIFFLAEFKKKKNLWKAGTGALKSRDSMLKSNVSFISVYLQ